MRICFQEMLLWAVEWIVAGLARSGLWPSHGAAVTSGAKRGRAHVLVRCGRTGLEESSASVDRCMFSVWKKDTLPCSLTGRNL